MKDFRKKRKEINPLVILGCVQPWIISIIGKPIPLSQQNKNNRSLIKHKKLTCREKSCLWFSVFRSFLFG